MVRTAHLSRILRPSGLILNSASKKGLREKLSEQVDFRERNFLSKSTPTIVGYVNLREFLNQETKSAISLNRKIERIIVS